MIPAKDWPALIADWIGVVLLMVAVFCFALAVMVEVKDRQERKRQQQEIPPVEERPAMPRSVRDRIALRERQHVTKTAQARLAAHARSVHLHDREVAEFREVNHG